MNYRRLRVRGTNRQSQPSHGQNAYTPLRCIPGRYEEEGEARSSPILLQEVLGTKRCWYLPHGAYQSYYYCHDQFS